MGDEVHPPLVKRHEGEGATFSPGHAGDALFAYVGEGSQPGNPTPKAFAGGVSSTEPFVAGNPVVFQMLQTMQDMMKIQTATLESINKQHDKPQVAERVVPAPMATDEIDIENAMLSLGEAKRLSATVSANIKAAGAKLKKKLLQLTRCNSHIEKMKSSLASLSEGTIPTGFKPWKLPFESELWQSPMTSQLASTINVPNSLSREEARKSVYVNFLGYNLEIDLAVELDRKSHLVDSVSLDGFVGECLDIFDKEADGTRSAVDGVSLRSDMMYGSRSEVKDLAAKSYYLILEGIGKYKAQEIAKEK